MNNRRNVITLSVEVGIEYYNPDMGVDVALTDLFAGEGDHNPTELTEKEFIVEIENGNVVTASIHDDPIAYAVIKDGKIIDLYISYMFRSDELEKHIREFIKG